MGEVSPAHQHKRLLLETSTEFSRCRRRKYQGQLGQVQHRPPAYKLELRTLPVAFREEKAGNPLSITGCQVHTPATGSSPASPSLVLRLLR